MLPEEIAALLKGWGEPAFRASQIFSWLHQKQVDSYDRMGNIPAKLRARLEEEYLLPKLAQVDALYSAKGNTNKYLFALDDGNVIESVWMKHKHGNSVCISTQVGCRMGCTFCASTLGGMVRNLHASEMLEQIYAIQRLTGERVSHVDLMGSGEPMDNLDEVIRFVHLISHEKGLHISQRNLTLSTCGVVPGIDRLAQEHFALTLAVSLHAPDNEKRRHLMPVGNRWSVPELMDACIRYFETTGRRISYEYALIAGENDKESDAAALAALLSGQNCHVNLIPVNPVKERGYLRSEQAAVHRFQNKLENYGINVTIRREMGADIDGACGQLRKSYLNGGRKA